MMKQWAIRILKLIIFLAIFFGAVAFGFVQWTLSDTSISVLEEKINRQGDPYLTKFQNINLEDGSVVKKEELEAFYLYSTEKNSFDDFYNQRIQDGSFLPLKEGNNLVQINKNIEIKNFMINDCTEVYCFQHYLSFDYIPSIFWKGLIAVEDERFLDHHGVDVKSVLRAAVTNIKKMKFEQGGSTISQQLVKNLFFTNEKKVSRKVKELILSVYIESKFPKEKILEAYLNEVNWGALQGIRVKGVFAASAFYFNKKPSEITPYEGAILVSLLKGPGYFSPLKKIERLKERTAIVYKKLVTEGVVPDDKNNIWNEKEWKTWELKLHDREKSRYQQSIWRTLNDIEPTISNYEKFVLIQKVQDVRSLVREKLKTKGHEEETDDISVKVLLGSMVDKNWYSYYSRIERNKEKALTTERHQIGSTIKPIVYSIYEDFGKKFSDKVSTREIKLKLNSGVWSPKEAHEIKENEVTLIEALLKSYNRPVIHLGNEVGFDKVEPSLQQYFKNLKLPLKEFPSQLLGSMELSLYELKDSYFQFITEQCRRVNKNEKNLSDSVLYLLSDPNLTTVEHSVDSVMQRLRFFGKTGTTNNGYDNWYVAFDGKNLTLIWVGYEGERKTKSLGLYGATTAFNVFQNYYRDRGKRFTQFSCDLIK